MGNTAQSNNTYWSSSLQGLSLSDHFNLSSAHRQLVQTESITLAVPRDDTVLMPEWRNHSAIVRTLAGAIYQTRGTLGVRATAKLMHRLAQESSQRKRRDGAGGGECCGLHNFPAMIA